MTIQFVRLADIEIRGRQRKDIATGPLNELKESILKTGLLHPPVCWFDTPAGKWVLTAGERRVTALRKILADKQTFRWADIEFFRGEANIPITPLGDYLDEIGRFEAELGENLFREDLSWPDRCRALADLHALRVKSNPTHTKEDTGHELIARGVYTPTADGGAGAAARAVSQAVIIAQHLDNDKIASARNAAEALSLIYRQQEELALAALARRGLALAKSPLLTEIRHGSLLDILPKLDPASFDLICADPPYGVGASGSGFRARTAVHHNYEDTPEVAREIASCILTEGFRITKPRANVFIFCDIELFDWLKTTAANMGWTPFKRPLIWQKSHSEGLAPWGGAGPRITTEFIFYATKSQRGLNASPTDVFDFPRVSRNERTHGGEKPVELLKALISCASLPGERVLDPCCGSGSAIVAAKALGRAALGIERDLDYYNTAMANLHGRS